MDNLGVTYFQLQVPLESVHLLRDISGCIHFWHSMQTLLEYSRNSCVDPKLDSLDLPCVVGIDAEWQPMTSGSAQSKVSILQIATRREVFIIDMLSMSSACVGEMGSEANRIDADLEQKSIRSSLTLLFRS